MSSSPFYPNEAAAYDRTVYRWLMERLWTFAPTLLEGAGDEERAQRALRLVERQFLAVFEGKKAEEICPPDREEIIELYDLAHICQAVVLKAMAELLSDKRMRLTLRARARATVS
jgi:hypothetical protein